MPAGSVKPCAQHTVLPNRSVIAMLCGLVLASVFLWSYWTTLGDLVHAWNAESDYSHGFFVFPLALCFLWLRRESFPSVAIRPGWLGLLLMAASVVLRAVGALFFIEALDGWSIVLWIGGAVWLVAGWQVFRWALPAIGFLLFMVPLPFRMEGLLSLPLQRLATMFSSFMLQLLGQPALAEGNTILLGHQQLEVEQACSGLRIFMGIVALACASVIVTRRTWWEKLVLLASAAPIALLANTLRIVLTGLLYQYVSGAAARKFSHDIAGWAMIPVAAAMFALVLWYLHRVVREDQVMEVGELMQQRRVEFSSETG